MSGLIFSYAHFLIAFKYSVKILDVRKTKIIADILKIQIRKMQKCAGIIDLSHLLELKKCISALFFYVSVQRHR